MKKRLAIIATHPIQYYVPIYRALAQMPRLEVEVFYGSDFSVRGYRDAEFGVPISWDVPLTEGYDHTFLGTGHAIGGVQGFLSLRPAGLRRHLQRFRPDAALISAYLPYFWWEAMSVLRMLGIPTLLRAETTDVALPRSPLKTAVRTLMLRAFYGHVDRFLAIGANSREHYLRHAVPPERIGWSPYCVDTEFVESQVASYSPRRAQLRRELGFADHDLVLMFAGKLIPKKDPLTLVSALEALPEAERSRTALVVAGDGELAEEVERRCRQVLGSRCVFAGFVNQSRLGGYYAAADCLVLPSAWGETWGLVVNEAMQFGLPAIVSDRVGCHPDLIIEGETGLVFPAGDVDALKSCLSRVINQLAHDRTAVASRCREKVEDYSVAAAANGIRAALDGLAGEARAPQAPRNPAASQDPGASGTGVPAGRRELP